MMNYLFFRRDFHKPNIVLGFVILLFSLNQQTHRLPSTLQASGWSVPQTISGYHFDSFPPFLIADQNRTVHAFSSQRLDNGGGETTRAIFYNQWTLEYGWTDPVDILLSPFREARITDVYLDESGIFHIVFFGGDNTSANIYYTYAPASLANETGAWSYPFLIGEEASDPENAVLVEDEMGALHVVYTGRQSGNGIYVVSSSDKGASWSKALPIFFTSIDKPEIGELHIIMTNSGWMHAVWGIYNVTGQGRGIYYSSSLDGDAWNEPILLADAQEGLGTQRPTIIEYNDTLFVLYATQVPNNKFVMRRSFDGGETWDLPSIIFPRHEGVNGASSLIIDGSNGLHLFFGERIPGDPDIHGMWHSIFTNNRWIEPEAVIKGPKFVDLEGRSGFDPNFARAVVSQGNRILLTWKTDPSSGHNGVWYSYTKIDAPEIPIVQLPTIDTNTLIPPVSAFIEDTVGISPLPSTPSLINNVPDITSKSNNPGWIFYGVITLVSLFIAAVVVAAIRRSR